MTETTYREPPHSLGAEQSLLGAILVNNEAHDRVSGFLEARHFFDPLHGQIYETAARLIAAGRRANPLTLSPYFESADPISPSETVPQYLGRLGTNATTIINVRDYARAIHDLSVRRSLIDIGETMVNAAYDSPVDFPPKEQIEEAEGRLYKLAEHVHGGSGEVSAPAMYAAAVSLIEEAYKNRGSVRGLCTGLKDLDAKIGGLRPGHLIILAGRPSMGKTSLATEIIGAQSVPVHFFSAEMTAAEIGLRLLSSQAGLPGDRLLRGDLGQDQWRQLMDWQHELSTRPLWVDPTAALSIAQLTARARRVKRRQGTALIAVDYIQLLRGSHRAENRNLEVGEITGGLKALAKELSVPVLALSQLSRDVEKRSDKRPQLSDLRDSGSIEQDADLVLFLYRDEYYVERERPAEGTPEHKTWTARLAACAGLAEVVIAKNRHGPVGIVRVQFDAATTRFSNLAVSDQTDHLKRSA